MNAKEFLTTTAGEESIVAILGLSCASRWKASLHEISNLGTKNAVKLFGHPGSLVELSG